MVEKTLKTKSFILTFDEEQIETKDIIAIIKQDTKIINEKDIIKKMSQAIKDSFKADKVEINEYGMSIKKNILPIYFCAHITMKKIDFYRRFQLFPMASY